MCSCIRRPWLRMEVGQQDMPALQQRAHPPTAAHMDTHTYVHTATGLTMTPFSHRSPRQSESRAYNGRSHFGEGGRGDGLRQQWVTVGHEWQSRETDGGKAGWVEERSSNAEAVENALEAPLGEGMVRWMGEGEIKAGTGQFERRSYHSSFSQLACCRLGHFLPSPEGVLVSNSSFRECTQVCRSTTPWQTTRLHVLGVHRLSRPQKEVWTESWWSHGVHSCPYMHLIVTRL